MSEDQIANALGEIRAGQDALISEFRRYVEFHDARHDKIEQKLEQHAADINQAKGAKALLLALAGLVSAVIAFLGKKLFP